MTSPKDERSGSATDAGVPEFMDFVMTDRPEGQDAVRGGLAWLDTECRRRFAKTFVACAAAERTAVLDDIAWPDRAKPELSHGVAFFNRFRDLTASGFWSSKMGVEDLQYIGNVAVTDWQGCPPAALEKLGGDVVGVAGAPLDTKDFSPWFGDINQKNPDVLFLAFAGTDSLRLMTQLHSFGMTKTPSKHVLELHAHHH